MKVPFSDTVNSEFRIKAGQGINRKQKQSGVVWGFLMRDRIRENSRKDDLGFRHGPALGRGRVCNPPGTLAAWA